MSAPRSVSATFAQNSSPDTQPPTAPSNVTAQALSATQIKLTWSASTDNVGVHHYNVFRNGAATPIGTATSTQYFDNTVSSSTTYSYTVKAVDAAGNVS